MFLNLKHYYNLMAQRVKFLPLIKEHVWLRQFIKFSIAGGACTLIDFVIYIFLTRFFSFWQGHLTWANFASVCLSATINFIWNKKWTFRSGSPNLALQYLKFWVVVIGGIVLYQWIFVFSLETLRLFDLIGKMLATVIAWILRFIFNKFWTFRNS